MGNKKLVVLTGAGISAESGLKTFRDGDGLWENHSVYDVATPEAWNRDPKMVLEFYAARWEQVCGAQPNACHTGLAALENDFDIQIITQNIDDLHEKAGSTNILHLHGEITKVKSSQDPDLIYKLENSKRYISLGDVNEEGHQLRPHVVWFGEPVPAMVPAIEIAQQAEILLIIGTSLQVYPAASLYGYIPSGTPIVILDPVVMANFESTNEITVVQKTAAEGIKEIIQILNQWK